MTAPLIGISTTTGQEISGALPGLPRTNVSADYVDAVLAAGGVPVLLPLFDPTGREAVVAAQVELLDGLILTGGHDVDPLTYGQERRPGCGPSLPFRDAHDLALLAAAADVGIPVLAICRGFQVVNVAHGGTLVQDLPTERPGTVVHWQTAAPDQPSHDVVLEPSGWLAPLLGTTRVPVVSYHHQGVDRLGEGLEVAATAADGLVEAISADHGRVRAVQWHPEMSHRHDPAGLALFGGLVAAALSRRAGRGRP